MSQDEGREEREVARIVYAACRAHEGRADGPSASEAARQIIDRLRTPTAEPSEPVTWIVRSRRIADGDLSPWALRMGPKKPNPLPSDTHRIEARALVYAHPVPEDTESAEVERLREASRAMHGAIQKVFAVLNAYAKNPYGEGIAAHDSHGVIGQVYADLASQWAPFDEALRDALNRETDG